MPTLWHRDVWEAQFPRAPPLDPMTTDQSVAGSFDAGTTVAPVVTSRGTAPWLAVQRRVWRRRGDAHCTRRRARACQRVFIWLAEVRTRRGSVLDRAVGQDCRTTRHRAFL